MNNIKYRAYDERNEEMVYSDKEDCFYVNTKGVLFMYAIPKSESGLETLYYKNYDVMQFTGKVDCKGVEVYGGDIIEFNGANVPIVWNKEWCCWEIGFDVHSFEGVKLQNLDFSDWCDRAYVIGNIYQNKELLP